MFGYLVINADRLTIEEKQHYRSFYCGLCKSLQERHGALSRITLTYDMTFLVLFLSALYNHEKKIRTERCIIHPFKANQYWLNEITNYAADMSIVLTYYNFLDDWVDEKKVLPLWKAKLFERKYKQVVNQYPDKCAIINNYLEELAQIEKSGELNPDLPANCFGNLMSEIFIFKEDKYAKDLRAFGKALGKFIYIMDACLDLEKDLKKERYNPLVTLSSKDFKTILTLLMADCTEKYKQLPINQDKKLIENILYSGVWTRYEAKNKKRRDINNDTRSL
ncbi:MAG TPA: hypothetical protein GXX38_10560 [Clostridia bacterium]|nr:hypothetical protein [Clostridia bacterium]